MTPLKAIRTKCIDCAGGELGAVRSCDFREECPLWPFRMGKGVRGKGGLLKPIKRYSHWCMNGQSVEVRLCPCGPRCALYQYRLGRRPSTMPRLSKKVPSRTYIGVLTPIEGQDGQGQNPEPFVSSVLEVAP